MPGKRAWRKLVKKRQRQRRRQKLAQERDKQEAIEQTKKEADPVYQKWLEQQAELEEFERLANERQQQYQEAAWLRREAQAQRQFRLDAAKQRELDAEQERLREKAAQELAAHEHEQRKRCEERQRLAVQAAAEFEEMMQRLDNYLDSAQRTPPIELQRMVDTHPEERLCEFFTRTNSCRYGNSCTFNHRRPMLGRILLIRHFFQHLLLQPNVPHEEYAAADEHLELTERDLRADYDEFFKDVVSEFEKFGKIVNFRALRNTLAHLSGHIFVEYADERFARLYTVTRPLLRYQAFKRGIQQFENLARCCLRYVNHLGSMTRRNNCGYLHLLRNPNNVFNTDLELTKTPRNATKVEPKTPSWNDPVEHERNWRWSESPEPELHNATTVQHITRRRNRRISTSPSNQSERKQWQRSPHSSAGHSKRRYSSWSRDRSSRRK